MRNCGESCSSLSPVDSNFCARGIRMCVMSNYIHSNTPSPWFVIQISFLDKKGQVFVFKFSFHFLLALWYIVAPTSHTNTFNEYYSKGPFLLFFPFYNKRKTRIAKVYKYLLIHNTWIGSLYETERLESLSIHTARRVLLNEEGKQRRSEYHSSPFLPQVPEMEFANHFT